MHDRLVEIGKRHFLVNISTSHWGLCAQDNIRLRFFSTISHWEWSSRFYNINLLRILSVIPIGFCQNPTCAWKPCKRIMRGILRMLHKILRETCKRLNRILLESCLRIMCMLCPGFFWEWCCRLWILHKIMQESCPRFT